PICDMPSTGRLVCQVGAAHVFVTQHSSPPAGAVRTRRGGPPLVADVLLCSARTGRRRWTYWDFDQAYCTRTCAGCWCGMCPRLARHLDSAVSATVRTATARARAPPAQHHYLSVGALTADYVFVEHVRNSGGGSRRVRGGCQPPGHKPRTRVRARVCA